MKSKEIVELIIIQQGSCIGRKIPCDNSCIFQRVHIHNGSVCTASSKSNIYEFKYDKALNYYISKYGVEEAFKLLQT